jgi:signal peptidase I
MNDSELDEFMNAQTVLDDDVVEEPKSMKRVRAAFEVIEIIIFTLAIIFTISCLFLRHAVVDGGSMKNTLFNGEHLIISDFLYTPKNGDIVVFQPENSDSTSPLIKRVIATPGQTVEMRNGIVYINGVATSESYVFLDGEIDPAHRDYPETLIPDGYVFVLGDHRNNSKDSRYDEIGLVDMRSILGRVICRITPLSKFGAVE